MKKVLNYISSNSKLIKYILIGVFVLLFLKQCNQVEQLKTEVEQTKIVANRNYNNLLASQDSIKVEKNKNGQLVSKISSYQFEINTLSDKNEKLIASYNELLNINSDLNDINSLISAELKIKDSIINAWSNISYQDDNTINLEFADDKEWDKYNWRKFNASIKLFKQDSLFKIGSSQFNYSQGISLTAAILENEGRQELRISTPYPGIEFTQIENINLVNDKLNPTLQKPKNWGLGIGIQYGINLNNQQVVNWGPSIGVGLYYTPSWLRF